MAGIVFRVVLRRCRRRARTCGVRGAVVVLVIMLFCCRAVSRSLTRSPVLVCFFVTVIIVFDASAAVSLDRLHRCEGADELDPSFAAAHAGSLVGFEGPVVPQPNTVQVSVARNGILFQ